MSQKLGLAKGARTLLSALVKKLRRSRDTTLRALGLERCAVSPASRNADRSVRAPLGGGVFAEAGRENTRLNRRGSQ